MQTHLATWLALQNDSAGASAPAVGNIGEVLPARKMVQELRAGCLDARARMSRDSREAQAA